MDEPFDLEATCLSLSEDQAEWALNLDSELFYTFLGHPEMAGRSFG